MSRKHIWYFLRDQNGRAIRGADLRLYLAGTKNLATVYAIPVSGSDDEIDQSTWTTDTSGFFEFFIGDFTETTKVGYTAAQLFDIQWVASAGAPIPSGVLRDREFFPLIYPVDETDAFDTDIDKLMSNSMAYEFEQHIPLSYVDEVHGLEPVDFNDPYDVSYNKLMSDDLARVMLRDLNTLILCGGESISIEASGALVDQVTLNAGYSWNSYFAETYWVPVSGSFDPVNSEWDSEYRSSDNMNYLILRTSNVDRWQYLLRPAQARLNGTSIGSATAYIQDISSNNIYSGTFTTGVGFNLNFGPAGDIYTLTLTKSGLGQDFSVSNIEFYTLGWSPSADGTYYADFPHALSRNYMYPIIQFYDIGTSQQIVPAKVKDINNQKLRVWLNDNSLNVIATICGQLFTSPTLIDGYEAFAAEIQSGETFTDDDGHTDTPSFYTSFTFDRIGKYSGSGQSVNSFFGFRGLDIPSGAIIESAILQLRAASTLSGTTCNVNIYLEAADNPFPPTSLVDYNARVMTSAVAWNSVPSMTAGTWYDSPDISSIVQEVVDRPGWSSGQNIVAYIKDNGSTLGAYRNISSYNAGITMGVKLVITGRMPITNNVINTLIMNGSFEDDDPEGWNWTTGGSAGNLTYENAPDPEAYIGDAIGLQNGSGSDDIYVYQSGSHTPLVNMRLTFWTRGNGSVAGRYSIYNEDTTSYIVPITSTGVTGTTYTEVTQNFFIPAGSSNIRIQFHCPATAGIAYFDEAELVYL